MKRLRLIFMGLGAPALLLLGVHEFAGTPISKGYETGFEWHADPSNNRLVLNADAEGNVTCWLVLQLPAGIQGFKAETSGGTHLRTYQKSVSGSTQMVAVVKDTAAPETGLRLALRNQFVYLSAGSYFHILAGNWELVRLPGQ